MRSARKAVHTAASTACGAASIASGAAASIASSAASKAARSAKRVSEAANSEISEQFEDAGGDALGARLLAGDGERARRYLSLAQAAYLQEASEWAEIAYDEQKNLRCIGCVTADGVLEIGFRGTIVQGLDGERKYAR